LDSADFYIPTVTGSTDKFLVHLFPNDLAGHLVVKIQFYPINDPSDTVTVTYDYTATEVVGVRDDFIESNFKVSPNPASQFIYVSNQSVYNSSVSVINQEGRLIETFDLNATEIEQVNCSSWPNGVYFLKMESEGKFGLKQIVINNN
jgi:DNA-binding beta-propeller fold protein YncE